MQQIVGLPKSEGTSLETLYGDWRCSSCFENNFARRIVCFKCATPKNSTDDQIFVEKSIYCTNLMFSSSAFYSLLPTRFILDCQD